MGALKWLMSPRHQDTRKPRVHDYRRGGWGHDFHFTPKEGTGGHEGSGCGWGAGIQVGDVFMLGSKQGAPYRVVKIDYYRDPRDMFSASVVYDTETGAGREWRESQAANHGL